jgi:glycogen synthase
MRILIISNFYPPFELGGMEIRCRETVDRLHDRGHVCHVLTSRYGIEADEASEVDITRALHLQADVDYYHPFKFLFRSTGDERANQRILHRALDAFRPDVIFIWGMWNLSARVAYWAEQWLPGRVAYTIAGYWLMEPSVHESYWRSRPNHFLKRVLIAPARWLVLRILKRSRKIYSLRLERVSCVSEYVRNKLDKAGVLPHGACVIYNGIDPRPFIESAGRMSHRRTDALHLVYTGTLVPHKGVHTAIEALGVLRNHSQAEGLSLTIVGGGHPDYEAYLRKRVETLELQEMVRFYGRVSREQIATILADHEVFLFTSTYEEPIARSVMEAMASGLAVIATPVGGQQEMLEDGVNALVYPPDEAPQLAERILQLRREPGLRVRLSKAGRRTILTRFTLERMVDEMEAWLEAIGR